MVGPTRASGRHHKEITDIALRACQVNSRVAALLNPRFGMRAADSLLLLPSDPTAATEEILRRREEGGFSYIVVGANAVDSLAPVVADLTGH